jgi:hypothetical protein
MFKSINNKLTIDYQPNKSLIIEYGDYEKQKKYAFLILDWHKKSYRVQLFKVILFWIVWICVAFLIKLPPFIAGLLPFVILFIFYFIAINLTFYYKLEITPQKVIEKDLKRTKEYLFLDKITMEVDGLEKDKLFGFSIDENFYSTFDTELEQPQKPIVLKAMIELFNLELTETKENKVDKMSWRSSIYQSKN